DIFTVDDYAWRRNRTGLLFQQVVVRASDFLAGRTLRVLKLIYYHGRRGRIGCTICYGFGGPVVVNLLLVSHQGLVYVPPSLSLACFSQWGHSCNRHGGVAFIGGWVLAIQEVELADVDDQIARLNRIFHVFPGSYRQVGAVRAGEVFVEIYFRGICGCVIRSQNYGIIFKGNVKGYVFDLGAAATLPVDHDVDDNDCDNNKQSYNAPQETGAALLIRICYLDRFCHKSSPTFWN